MKYLSLLVLLFVILTFYKRCFTQNLIPNHSFEGEANKPALRPWMSINNVDFFVYREGKIEQKIRVKPARLFGQNIFERTVIYWYNLFPARTGIAYVGLRFWPGHYEFLVVELREPLKAHQTYFFEMYIKSSKNTNSFLREFGVALYSYIPPYQRQFALNDYPPQIRIFNTNGFSNSDEWEVIRGVYTAEGGENYIIIGNFQNNDAERFVRKKFTLKIREAYYFIDDVGLFPVDENGWPIRN